MYIAREIEIWFFIPTPSPLSYGVPLISVFKFKPHLSEVYFRSVHSVALLTGWGEFLSDIKEKGFKMKKTLH
jgi:hypothetical protein